MSLEELEQREEDFKEFGEILVRRHGQNYFASFHNDQRVTADEASVRFGRYLRAARINANLSVKDLAAKTRLSQATLMALEQGFILACDIKPKWLKDLAEALTENTEDFNLILGRQISGGNSRWFTERLLIHWRNWLAYYKVVLSSKPMYAAGSALLICLVIGIALIWPTNTTAPPTLPDRPTYSFIDIQPERRLNLIKAEFHLENQVYLASSSPGDRACCAY